MTTLALPHSFAIFMDGPASGKVRKVIGRPNHIQAPAADNVVIAYELRRAYAEHGLAVLFYKEVKPR
jgi:hypothetical protein